MKKNKKHKRKKINKKNLIKLVIFVIISLLLYIFIIVPIGEKNTMIKTIYDINELIQVDSSSIDSSYINSLIEKNKTSNSNDATKLFIEYLEELLTLFENFNNITKTDDLEKIYTKENAAQEIEKIENDINQIKKDYITKNNLYYAKSLAQGLDESSQKLYNSYINSYSYTDIISNRANLLLQLLSKAKDIEKIVEQNNISRDILNDTIAISNLEITQDNKNKIIDSVAQINELYKKIVVKN